MNFWNILVAALVLAVLAGAVALLGRGKKDGGSSCCHDCSRCAGCDSAKRKP